MAGGGCTDPFNIPNLTQGTMSQIPRLQRGEAIAGLWGRLRPPRGKGSLRVWVTHGVS